MSLTLIIQYVSRWLYARSYQLLPPGCILCRYPTHRQQLICQACEQDLPILTQHCRQCAQFLTTTNLRCGTCLTTPPPFEYTFALFPYEPPIIQCIIALKFQRQLSFAQALGQLLGKHAQTHWYRDLALPDVIIPVPLHASRLKERGFNQALEIARPVSKYLALPLDVEGLVRIKPTAAQSGLAADIRKSNVAGAFRATADYTAKTVALIDDVVTTGSTVAACCATLKQAGAQRVDVWCCARRG